MCLSTGSFRQAGRRILLGLRLGVIALTLFALLRPTFVSTTSQAQTATILFLLDKSRSMKLPSQSDGLSRWEAQQALWRELNPKLKELQKQFTVKLYYYDSELEQIDWEAGALEASPSGKLTDISGSLARSTSPGTWPPTGRRVSAG